MYNTEHRCSWNKKERANWPNVSYFANYRLEICICQTSSNRPSQSKALFLTFANTFIMYTIMYTSKIRLHFACIITLNKQEMNFRWCFLCRRRCGMFSAHWEFCQSTIPKPCPQMMYISYWMAVKREISSTLSFCSPYADHLVEKVILSSLYHRRTVES